MVAKRMKAGEFLCISSARPPNEQQPAVPKDPKNKNKKGGGCSLLACVLAFPSFPSSMGNFPLIIIVSRLAVG